MADEVQVDLEKVEELQKKLAAEGGTETTTTVETKPEDVERTNEESVDELKKRLAEANQRAADATHRAAQAEGTVHQARTAIHKNQIETINDAIESTGREKDLIKTRLIEAQNAQDWQLAADLNEQFTTMTADIANLKAKKIDVETRPPPAEPTVQRATDPVEGLAHYMDTNGAPRAAAWVRAHPEYARDQTKYRRMLAAHNLAETDGHPAETDGYFAAVEKTLGIQPAVANGAGGAESGAAEATGGRQVSSAPPAAPPSRSGNGSSSTRTGRFATLTADEVEIARNNKQTNEEYWLAKQALIKEGKIGKPH